MSEGITLIKQGIAQLRAGSEETVNATAQEVRELGTTCSEDYAQAIWEENSYGGDTAEVYFYRFAPEGFPSPDDRKEYQALMNRPLRREKYISSCYERWVEELQRVQEIVTRHAGIVEVQGMKLQDFFGAVQEAGETPEHRIHVRFSFPGIMPLQLISGLESTIRDYETR